MPFENNGASQKREFHGCGTDTDVLSLMLTKCIQIKVKPDRMTSEANRRG